MLLIDLVLFVAAAKAPAENKALQHFQQQQLATGTVTTAFTMAPECTLANVIDDLTSHDHRTYYTASFEGGQIYSFSLEDTQQTLLAGAGGGAKAGLQLLNSGGSRDGVGTGASILMPAGLAISEDGTTLYVTESIGGGVRSIDVMTRAVSTIVAPYTALTSACGVAVLPGGESLLVMDLGNHTLTRVNIKSGAVSLVAGDSGRPGLRDGVGSEARFNSSWYLTVTRDGSTAYVGDTNNRVIRKVDLETSSVTTIAGSKGVIGTADGVGTHAQFNTLSSLALSADETYMYISDEANGGPKETLPPSIDGRNRSIPFVTGGGLGSRIRRLDLSTHHVTSLAGDAAKNGLRDGVGTSAQLTHPEGLVVSADGHSLLFVDCDACSVRRLEL